MPVAIDRAIVQQLIAHDATLVDVLPHAEFETLHLPRAVNLPLRELARRALDELEPTQPVIVYCHDSL